ncbi:MAG: hypothetical protein AB1405_14920 [Bdellovibrionota bacterium]
MNALAVTHSQTPGGDRPGPAAGKLVFTVAGTGGVSAAGGAAVRSWIGPAVKGRFVIVLCSSPSFRAAVRRSLSEPIGKNRVLVDAAPRRRGPGSIETDFEKIAERVWFYRRLGATHFAIEADGGRSEDAKSLLVRLLSTFGPLCQEEELTVDLVVPAQAAPAVRNRWMLSYLLTAARERSGRDIGEDAVRIAGVNESAFLLDEEPAADATSVSPLAPLAPETPPAGQLGLL